MLLLCVAESVPLPPVRASLALGRLARLVFVFVPLGAVLGPRHLQYNTKEGGGLQRQRGQK